MTAAALLLCSVSPAHAQIENTALLIQKSPAEGGKINIGEGVHRFEKDAEVTLRAIPNPGYQFVYWLGDVSDAASSTTVVYLDTPKIVIAVFESVRYEFVDLLERAQVSLGRGGLIPSPPDYARTGVSPIGGRRPPKFRWPKLPQLPEAPEFPVPEEGEPEFPVPGDGDDVDFPVPIPEPATVVLLGFGGLIVCRRAGKRKSTQMDL